MERHPKFYFAVSKFALTFTSIRERKVQLLRNGKIYNYFTLLDLMETSQVKKKRDDEAEESEEVGEPPQPNFEPLLLTPEIAELLKNEVQPDEETEEDCQDQSTEGDTTAPELEDSITVEQPLRELSLVQDTQSQAGQFGISISLYTYTHRHTF